MSCVQHCLFYIKLGHRKPYNTQAAATGEHGTTDFTVDDVTARTHIKWMILNIIHKLHMSKGDVAPKLIAKYEWIDMGNMS